MPADNSPCTVMNCLEFIRQNTLIVADTADFEQLKALKAQDGTTNPTLILQASQIDMYKPLLKNAVEAAKATGKTGDELVLEACDQCAIAFGCEILKIVPGVVSTEVDACLSYDTAASVTKARKIIKMYEEKGISKDRILIKMATTWEGCEAAKELEADGIRTNMTLLFGMAQACAAAEAGAFLISPFVGRILDYMKSKYPELNYWGPNDPGVKSVTEVYNYYKKHNYKTIVMGASFRNTEEIKQLCGCDRVTVSPKLLKELAEDTNMEMTVKLTSEKAMTECSQSKIDMSKETYDKMLAEDEMATFKLSEGITNFTKDHDKLKDFIKTLL